jgi:hypothetical protein
MAGFGVETLAITWVGAELLGVIEMATGTGITRVLS